MALRNRAASPAGPVSARKVKDPITQADFDELLRWLDPERARAGEKYEAIRQRLIKLFEVRGCSDPHDLADETINRVTRRAGELADDYTGDPSLYFYGVAQKVFLEYLRHRSSPSTTVSLPDPAVERIPMVPTSYDEEQKEFLLSVFDECFETLSKANRNLLLDYYGGAGSFGKHRKEIANQMSLSQTALRKRVQRLRIAIRECMELRMSYEQETEVREGYSRPDHEDTS